MNLFVHKFNIYLFFLLLPWLASANPLAMIASEDVFEGDFSHPQLTLSIAKNGQFYQGFIQRGEQRYPFKAARRDKILRGFFTAEKQHYPLRLTHEDHSLILATGQARYHLNRVSSPAPTLPAAPASATPAPPQPAPPQPGQQKTAAPPQQSFDYTALSISTGLRLHQFVGALRYWLSGAVTEQQAVYLMHAHLLPETDALILQLKQLETLLGATTLSASLASMERQYVRKLVELSGKGVSFFQDWRKLLEQLLRLRTAGNQAELTQLTASRLPLAVNGSVAYLRDFTLLVRASGSIPGLQQPGLNPSASLAPDKILKWETLRNMSEAMREGMDIFKLWRQRK
jgi:hypothetical protein